MLPPRHLLFTALEGALVDRRTDSFSGAEEALSELERLHIPWVLLTSRTRVEIEPVRRKLVHIHPFITENGGGIFFPDGYFHLRIPGALRRGRYFCIAQGRPYEEVCAALDELAEECGVGVAGFHHLSPREIAENAGLPLRSAELARHREFDEPFFFTSADDRAIARFVETARKRGFDARRAPTFWHLSAGCDAARAVRTVAALFRQAGRARMRAVGIGGGDDDLPWLRAVGSAVLLPNSRSLESSSHGGPENQGHARKIAVGSSPGATGWNDTVLNIIR